MTGQEDETFSFSSIIEVKDVNGTSVAQPVLFDVSSSLRAVADQWKPQPTSLSYPAISFYIEAEEEWMSDGAISHSDTARYPGSAPSVVTMYMGSLTDRERLAVTPVPPATYSRKPTSSPEICFYHPNQQGESDGTSKHLHPGSCDNNGTQAAPSVSQVTVPVASASGVNIYGIPYPPDGHEIRFINSLGVHENIFVSGLPTKEVNITTNKYTIARQETLTQFSRGLAIKQNNYETWTFSSGPLDEAWASWYIHEFLMARWVWISINGTWIPCHVLPEETTVLANRPEVNILEVQFKLQMDIYGSPVW